MPLPKQEREDLKAQYREYKRLVNVASQAIDDTITYAWHTFDDDTFVDLTEGDEGTLCRAFDAVEGVLNKLEAQEKQSEQRGR